MPNLKANKKKRIHAFQPFSPDAVVAAEMKTKEGVGQARWKRMGPETRAGFVAGQLTKQGMSRETAHHVREYLLMRYTETLERKTGGGEVRRPVTAHEYEQRGKELEAKGRLERLEGARRMKKTLKKGKK